MSPPGNKAIRPLSDSRVGACVGSVLVSPKLHCVLMCVSVRQPRTMVRKSRTRSGGQ